MHTTIVLPSHRQNGVPKGEGDICSIGAQQMVSASQIVSWDVRVHEVGSYPSLLTECGPE